MTPTRVNVSDGTSTWPLLIEEDSSLTIENLQAMFPGATNLIQPSNESVGSPLNVRNGRIYNPFGWDAQLVYVAHCPSRLITSYHRRLRSPALLAKSINQYMFYFWDSDVKSSVVCIHKHYFVTFRHGSHLQLRLGEQLIIYKAVSEPTKTFNATVVLINENLDFILLNTKEKIVERASSLVDPEESEGFLLSGYGNDNQELTCLTGIVHRDGVYVDGPNKTCLGPFILGMGTSSPGDAGAGCWSNQGFIGMNLGSLAILTAPHQTATANAALFSPKNYIVPSQHLEIALVTEIRKELRKTPAQSPPKIEADHEATIEGIGHGVFRSSEYYLLL